MKVPVILNIQKYSVHDGDGIRTTVFFKGCPLRCTWCHNPESQHDYKELLYYAERCSLCGECITVCPQKSLYLKEKGIGMDEGRCELCESCVEDCISGAREVAGKQYTIKELMKEIEKDRMFYEESQGGVTLSGGEVMAQDMDYIVALLKQLKKKGYHVAVDTCGQAPWSDFERVLPYVDTFLYDIKHMNSAKHKVLTGVSNELILENLRRLGEAKASIYLRMPLIKDMNDDPGNISEIIDYIKKGIPPQKIFLLPYHPTGMDKYSRLGRVYEGIHFESPSQKELEQIKATFCKNGLEQVQIGG